MSADEDGAELENTTTDSLDIILGAKWPPFFTTSTKLAFLLRQDVRGPAGFQDNLACREFLMWWLCIGRLEYSWSECTREQCEVAWEDTSITLGLKTMTIPRILKFILEVRSDVVTAVVSSRFDAVEYAIGWLYVYGVEEYKLYDVFKYHSFRNDRTGPSESLNDLSLLQRGIYSIRADVNNLFDLHTSAGRDAFRDWFANEWKNEFDLSISRAHFRPANQASDKPKYYDKGVALVGYASAELGVGEDVRMMTASCLKCNIPIRVFDVSSRTSSRQRDKSIVGSVAKEGNFRSVVFCLTAFDTAGLYLQNTFSDYPDQYKIGYWPWELPNWPAPWSVAFSLVDEIWASSIYTLEAFRSCSDIPVLHMPMAVVLPRFIIKERAFFGLEARRFLYVYVFDARSYLARKNPSACVFAFKRAFPLGNEPVGLVLKAMNSCDEEPAWQNLLDLVRSDSRIHLISATMDKSDVLALMSVCDAYISLHRAEGFGRTIAEAMLLHKPVIATGFSGSNELVNSQTALSIKYSLIPVKDADYPWGKDQYWAEPDIIHAANEMRRLFLDPKLCARIGNAGYKHVSKSFHPRLVGKNYIRRLRELSVY